MILKENETKMVLYLARCFEGSRAKPVQRATLLKEFRLDEVALDAVLRELSQAGYIYGTFAGFTPTERIVLLAREIELKQAEAEAAPDRVAQIIGWARRKWAMAVIIVLVTVVGAVIGIICTVRAFFRGG